MQVWFSYINVILSIVAIWNDAIFRYEVICNSYKAAKGACYETRYSHIGCKPNDKGDTK